jgi:hypothetical protein
MDITQFFKAFIQLYFLITDADGQLAEKEARLGEKITIIDNSSLVIPDVILMETYTHLKLLSQVAEYIDKKSKVFIMSSSIWRSDLNRCRANRSVQTILKNR